MTENPYDVCYCGDYRHQHVNGIGRCMLGSLCTPTPCQKFRLASAATEIPKPYTHPSSPVSRPHQGSAE